MESNIFINDTKTCIDDKKSYMSLPGLNLKDIARVSFREFSHFKSISQSLIKHQRTASFFSLEDYEMYRKEKKKSAEFKGEFTVIHQDRPVKPETICDTPLSFIESEKRKNRAISILSESSTGYHHRKRQQHHIPDITANTYQLEPDKRFNEAIVRNIIKDEIEKLKNFGKQSRETLVTALADTVKSRVKLCDFSRYRYVVTVSVGDVMKQGLEIASQFFWDKDRDNYVSEFFQNNENFVVINVFAIYLD